MKRKNIKVGKYYRHSAHPNSRYLGVKLQSGRLTLVVVGGPECIGDEVISEYREDVDGEAFWQGFYEN